MAAHKKRLIDRIRLSNLGYAFEDPRVSGCIQRYYGRNAAAMIELERFKLGRVLENIRSAPVILANNILDYFSGRYPKDDSSVDTPSSYPNAAPPLTKFFWEGDGPSGVFVKGQVPLQYGYYGEVIDLTSDTSEVAIEGLRQMLKLVPEAPYPKDARWHVSLYGFYRSHSKKIMVGSGEFHIPILENGTPANFFMKTDLTAQALKIHGGDHLCGIKETLYTETYPVLMTFSFMNCKNVEIADGPAPPHKIDRAHQKKFGIPMRRYKVLKIDPSRSRRKRPHVEHDPDARKKAYHICRGHFAVYDEKPLFGRIFGTFWVPQHARGAKSAGEVVKDYEVVGGKIKPD